MRGRLIALLLFACAGSRPVEMPRRAELQPARRWCVAVRTKAPARYEICTPLLSNCQLVWRGLWQFGGYVQVTEVGDCVLR